MVSNLSQMKKALAEGKKFRFVSHWREEIVGQVRVPTKVQTNAVYTIVDGEPDNKVSKANGGLGYYMPFGKASEWAFGNGICYWSSELGNTFYGLRFLEDEGENEQVVLLEEMPQKKPSKGGRKKVRHCPSKQFYEEKLKTYFEDCKDEITAYLLEYFGFDTFEDMVEAECNGYWGFDCGWVKLIPKFPEMYHEWELDNGKYCAEIFARPSWNPQSTTCQRVQVEKAIKDLGLEDVFYISTVLD